MFVWQRPYDHHILIRKKSSTGYLELFTLFTVIQLSFPNYFGGMRLDNIETLMKGDNRTSWFFPVGVIAQYFAPYFPGPDRNFGISEIQFFVNKDC